MLMNQMLYHQSSPHSKRMHGKLTVYTPNLCLALFIACLLKCSGHGHCDPITKRCICYQLWMENLIHRYLNDGESNCGEFACCEMYSKNHLSFCETVEYLPSEWGTYIGGRCCRRVSTVSLLFSLQPANQNDRII